MTTTLEQKAQKAAYMRKWRHENPFKWDEIVRRSRMKWKENNYEQHQECQRQHRLTVRLENLKFFGSKCCRCSFDDFRALQIDHVEGDGWKDRHPGGRRKSLSIWQLRRSIRDDPEGTLKKFQLLCANCNWIKKYEQGEHANLR